MHDVYKFVSESSVQGIINEPEFYEKLKLMCSVSDNTVVIGSRKGELVTAAANNDKNEIDDAVTHFLVNKDYDFLYDKSNDFHVIEVNDPNNNSEYLQAYCILPAGEKCLIRSSVDFIGPAVSLSNKFLCYIGLIVLLIGIISTIIITNKVSKPITRLTEISSQMANLNFENKYESTGTNEIDILGENINILSDKLESTISELKSANNSLKNDIKEKEEIEKMRKEFISNVSHEFKSPIALIQSYSEGLKDGIMDDEESRNYYLDVIIDESGKMNNLVKQMMSLSELQFGNIPFDIERFDVSELMNNVIVSYARMIEQMDITLTYYNKEENIYVWSDEFKVEEIIRNYLSNAIHYCMYEKEIDIRIETQKDKVRINIFNTGNPIPDDMAEHIWEQFYKGDKARSRDYGGSGIGLSVVKAIMESFKMDYGFDNMGNGVNFYFELPIK